jgi:type IV secretory pathway VirB3-like protein
MVNTREFSRPARRSLIERNLFLGVPQTGLLFLFCLGVIFVYGLRLYFMLAAVVILYLVMRALTAKDSYLIDITLESLGQKDLYLP